MDFSEKIGHALPNPFGYSMSYFSSWGLSDILDIKVLYIICILYICKNVNAYRH